jgi:hypothetical protein
MRSMGGATVILLFGYLGSAEARDHEKFEPLLLT